MAGHPLFRNADRPGTLTVRWRTLPASSHRPVTVTVVHPDGTPGRLDGMCLAWTVDRRLALVDVYVGTERHPAVFRVEDVTPRVPDGQG